jgi:hypothetical protein
MPPKATRTKKWGQANRDLLEDLTNRQLINISDTTHQHIKQVRDLYFWHCDKKKFRRNFRDFLTAWDLKIEYSGGAFNIVDIFACARPLTRRFFPLPSSFCL